MTFQNIIAAGVVAATSIAAPAMAQVTSASQLRDVQPTQWSYQAITNLVERYGCVAGYPNGTFRPGQPATRAELAALTNACLDRISEYQSAADAALAAALRAEFAKEIAATNTRVTALEVAAAQKAQGVGNYLGAGVLLNQQGVAGNGFSAQKTVSGATIQARYAVKNFTNLNAVSVRPYANLVGSPAGQIGAGGGALVSYDWSVSRAKSGVSRANVYAAAGYQIPFVNNTAANFQSAVGNRGQFVLALGVEGRISNSLVGFADLKFPTTNASSTGTYSPVFTTGLGFKF
jgi:S-layer homology domain